MSTPTITHYEVTNRRTGKVIICKTSAGANSVVDRIDNAHGSYIATRRAVWSA